MLQPQAEVIQMKISVKKRKSARRRQQHPWFEITPHEAGYSLTGYSHTSSFGSQFDNGSKKKPQDEFDMVYLQALCNSVLADEEELWKWIKGTCTVKEAAEACKKLKIPFPEANIANELSDRPKDFYVFKGQNTPTVIHIPLFNMINCGDKIEAWRKKYTTFQGPYSAEMITDLMKVAGRNIINNRAKLLEQICAVTKAKCLQAMARQNPTLGEVRIEPSLNKNEAEFIAERRKSVLQSLKKLQIKCRQIDEHTLTEQWSQHSKDGKVPFPIYTVIDKTCKQRNIGDPWFEITPHEAGYSLTGAFVDASNFGSKFHKGSKKNQQGEFDMLYLQALCGSALADEVEIKKDKSPDLMFLKKSLLLMRLHLSDQKCSKNKQHERRLEALARESGTGSEEVFAAGFKPGTREVLLHPLSEHRQQDPNSAATEKGYQVLMNLVDMNLSVLTGKDPSAVDEPIRTSLNDLSGGKMERLSISDKKAEKLNMKSYTMDVTNSFRGAWRRIIKCMNHWTWGRNYNFLHDMTGEAVPSTLQETETRDYEDAGLLLNSPYFSVLKKERDIDLIISLDFSEGDPFMMVKEAAKMCKELKIPFPEVNIPSEDLQKPKDFYVFKGKNTPTVIHIPLFNMINCGDKIETWRKSYKTFQGAYSAEKVTDLMEVAGKNITNNKDKLLEQIRAAVGQKGSRR
ncbi:cytosolic phospholipase A2 gamma-like [Chanodichthys erythropterus]|uniref:cytosolic phospholipase A2 gamma-like n=1 Tax=Chanodichthys erythropterus TaxID=933992 RepID=UPI00351DDA4C